MGIEMNIVSSSVEITIESDSSREISIWQQQIKIKGYMLLSIILVAQPIATSSIINLVTGSSLSLDLERSVIKHRTP